MAPGPWAERMPPVSFQIRNTGDVPSCLVDQKNAVRFVKFNILLGNLPGSVDYSSFEEMLEAYQAEMHI